MANFTFNKTILKVLLSTDYLLLTVSHFQFASTLIPKQHVVHIKQFCYIHYLCKFKYGLHFQCLFLHTINCRMVTQVYSKYLSYKNIIRRDEEMRLVRIMVLPLRSWRQYLTNINLIHRIKASTTIRKVSHVSVIYLCKLITKLEIFSEPLKYNCIRCYCIRNFTFRILRELVRLRIWYRNPGIQKR